MTDTDKQPLTRLRVVELARILAGPWAGQTLADLGADVIKIEAPEGDETRRWGPPFVEGLAGTDLGAAYFHCCNRGKRSLVADFNSHDDIALVKALVSEADVVIENFKVGGLAKYGLDYPSCAKLNPRVIYCSVTGFGQSGPYSSRPGYDAIVQAMSGMMDITGEPGREPQKIGVALADILTGLYGVVGIQAALIHRQVSGTGQHIDMALLDVMVGVLANQALNFLVSGNPPKRLGNAHPNIVPYQTFKVRDGHVMVAVGSDRQFADFCRVIGRTELAGEAAYCSNARRVENRDPLIALLHEALAAWSRDELLLQLERVGVPAGPINSLPEVFSDAQVLSRGMRLQIPLSDSAQGVVPGLRTPLMFSDLQLSLARSAPGLGEHSDSIATQLSKSSHWPSRSD